MFGSKKRAADKAATKAAHNADLDRRIAEATKLARELRAEAKFFKDNDWKDRSSARNVARLEDDAKWHERHAKQLKAQKLS
jgi:hypothetical protein